MLNKSSFAQFRLSTCIASIGMLLTLCVLPLAVRDAFFDVNRFKVEIVLRAVPVLFALMLASLLRGGDRLRRLPADVLAALMAACAFLLACVISSALSGFSQETLTGSEGRYCGLFFLLCCGAVLFMVALGAPEGRLLGAMAVACGAAAALLGILNAHGVDPFGFYDRIQTTQISLFLSTIGNIDFFGAYLSLIVPLACAGFSHAKGKGLRLFFGLSAGTMFCGIAASRSDSAFFAAQLACLVLAAASGDSLMRLQRALCLWAFAWAALPVMRPVLLCGAWEIGYSGVFEALCDTGLAWLLAAAFALLAGACALGARHGGKAPGRTRLFRMALILLTLLFALALCLIGYFTCARPDIELGGAASLLRIDDNWGTRRGYVYRLSMEAFSDFSIAQILFGGGVDCTKRILMPYFDDMSMLRYGTFNDAHCQLLQYLLTTGLLGAAAFAGFYSLLVRLLWRRMENDPLLCGVFASICGYAVTSMLGVAQPVIIITYFSLAALGVSRIVYLETREGKP